MSKNLPDDIRAYYDRGREQNRLFAGDSRLELVRTQQIIMRYAPPPPAVVLDVGGGAGVYALWLAQRGYKVHLIDIIPLHIEQALAASAVLSDHALASAQVGDARDLNVDDGIADVVLLLGPLYHLTDREDRLQALREAYRVLKPGGWLFAATISRFAALVDGLRLGAITDPYFAEVMENGLHDGQHRNPKKQRGCFATSYFHYPNAAQQEIAEAGFQFETTLAIEGPGKLLKDFDEAWEDEELRDRLLRLMETVEREPTILGVSGHIMHIGRK